MWGREHVVQYNLLSVNLFWATMKRSHRSNITFTYFNKIKTQELLNNSGNFELWQLLLLKWIILILTYTFFSLRQSSGNLFCTNTFRSLECNLLYFSSITYWIIPTGLTSVNTPPRMLTTIAKACGIMWIFQLVHNALLFHYQ